jgi:DNA-binding transcriptional MerR regulator
MSDNPIDVSFEDVNKKYYTIDEVSNILSIDQSKIIFYFEKLNDFLNITSVGMYQLFNGDDIENLKIIRNLEKDKNMTIKEIKDYLILNKQEVILKKENNNKLDKSVLNIFQTFANALMEQNAKIDTMHKTNLQLVESLNSLIKNQNIMQKELEEQKEINSEQLKEHKESNKKMIEQMNNVQKELAISKETNKKLEENIQNNFENINKKLEKDVKLVEDLSQRLQERKKEAEEQNQSQGFLSKFFNKKK